MTKKTRIVVTNTQKTENHAMLKMFLNGWADVISSIVKPTTALTCADVLMMMVIFNTKLITINNNFYN